MSDGGICVDGSCDAAAAVAMAVAALPRIEEAAAELHANSRRLRRATVALQRHVSSLLLCDGGTAALALGSAASRYEVETQRRRTLALQYRRTTSLHWRNVLLAELWDRLVVQEWYRKVVVEGFFSRVMAKLAGLEDRLERAAAALRPERRVCSIVPAALFSVCETEKEGSGWNAETKGAPAGEMPTQTPRWWWWWWSERRRQLRTVLFLSIRVIGDYINQRRSIVLGEDPVTVSPAVFTPEELSEVVQYILRSAAERQRFLSEKFTAIAQKPAFLQSLQASPTLRGYAQDWGIGALCQRQLDSQCRYEHCAQATLRLLREKSRTTSDMLVSRRQQREWDEARWYSLRAAAVSVLQLQLPPSPSPPPLQPHDAWVSDGAAIAAPLLLHAEDDDAAAPHPVEAIFDASECTLWLVLNLLRQQQAEEVSAMESTSHCGL